MLPLWLPGSACRRVPFQPKPPDEKMKDKTIVSGLSSSFVALSFNVSFLVYCIRISPCIISYTIIAISSTFIPSINSYCYCFHVAPESVYNTATFRYPPPPPSFDIPYDCPRLSSHLSLIYFRHFCAFRLATRRVRSPHSRVDTCWPNFCIQVHFVVHYQSKQSRF